MVGCNLKLIYWLAEASRSGSTDLKESLKKRQCLARFRAAQRLASLASATFFSERERDDEGLYSRFGVLRPPIHIPTQTS